MEEMGNPGVPDPPRKPFPPRYFPARRISGHLAITVPAGNNPEAAARQRGSESAGSERSRIGCVLGVSRVPDVVGCPPAAGGAEPGKLSPAPAVDQDPRKKGRGPDRKARAGLAAWPSRRRSSSYPHKELRSAPALATSVPAAPAAAQPGGLTRRIRPMRRKWATIGYRILRVSHFLHAISQGSASGTASVSASSPMM